MIWKNISQGNLSSLCLRLVNALPKAGENKASECNILPYDCDNVISGL